jgi:protein-S-isoprenylcysteine O-methyltransferase Ste14
VPVGFLFAALYIWLARPNWTSIGSGAAIALLGVGVRAAASGHVRKNQQLATTGPYAYTRNPLYLGSMIIALGFALAARSGWVAAVLVAIFAAIYIPVIRAEEAYLRSRFPDFEEYARRVPRLVPRIGKGDAGEGFSRELYLQHREYNALIGTLVMLAALMMKLIWSTSVPHS